MKNKLAIFDYCETLTLCQTANQFLAQYAYVKLRLHKKVAAWVLVEMPIFSRIGYIKRSRKKWLVWLLKGEKQADIESFAETTFLAWLIARENQTLKSELRHLQKLAFYTVILSGGLAVYIRAHNQYLGADLVIANELEFTNGEATGRILDKDCFGVEKVNRLRDKLALDSLDLKHSRAYSDCLTDLPMLELVGEGFIVEKGTIRPLIPVVA